MAEGTITPDEYMEKLERFVTLRTNGVKQANNAYMLRPYFDAAAQFYKNSVTAQCLHSYVQNPFPNRLRR